MKNIKLIKWRAAGRYMWNIKKREREGKIGDLMIIMITILTIVKDLIIVIIMIAMIIDNDNSNTWW